MTSHSLGLYFLISPILWLEIHCAVGESLNIPLYHDHIGHRIYKIASPISGGYITEKYLANQIDIYYRQF